MVHTRSYFRLLAEAACDTVTPATLREKLSYTPAQRAAEKAERAACVELAAAALRGRFRWHPSASWWKLLDDCGEWRPAYDPERIVLEVLGAAAQSAKGNHRPKFVARVVRDLKPVLAYIPTDETRGAL